MFTYDLQVRQGEQFNKTISIVDENGKPISLRNCSAMAQIRPKAGSATLTAEMSASVNASQGKITLQLQGNRTANIETGTYEYDVCTINGSKVKYYIGGKFRVLPKVTDANVGN